MRDRCSLATTAWRLRLCVVAATIAGATLAAGQVTAAPFCKPHHALPKIVLKTMGACDFDPATLSFRGDPIEQARCLMRGLDASRNLGPPPETLPDALTSRIGRDIGLPSRETLSSYLSKQDLEWDFAAYLWQPVSHAKDNDPDAPAARYFVLHDTSGPNFGHRAFPEDLDTTAHFNNLKNYFCADAWGKAHVVVNRAGDMILDHDFGIPWRETKFERALNFDGALKGLFLHVELIQPRKSAPGHSRYNDAQPPTPSFTTVQYDRAALLYVIASVRAGQWLIPAYHAALDSGIHNGHDDPNGFDIDSFANSLEIILAKLRGPQEVQASHQ